MDTFTKVASDILSSMSLVTGNFRGYAKYTGTSFYSTWKSCTELSISALILDLEKMKDILQEEPYHDN